MAGAPPNSPSVFFLRLLQHLKLNLILRNSQFPDNGRLGLLQSGCFFSRFLCKLLSPSPSEPSWAAPRKAAPDVIPV